VVPLLVLALSPPWGRGGRGELFVKWSADDPSLRTRIAALSPLGQMRLGESHTLHTSPDGNCIASGVWHGYPAFRTSLSIGERKGGLCFQWATELLVRLDALKLQTLELHWAESGANTGAEHNVIVVTARGQAFGEGILLDLWRYSGSLVWTHVGMDPDYHWKENKPELARRLGRTKDIASKQVRSTTKSN
jgi:hypothetical protein